MDYSGEATVYSLADGVPTPMRDGEAATGAIPARGTVGDLCSVRKLSRRGAVLHVEAPVQVGHYLSFELMDGRQIGGTVAWASGSEVVLRFDEDLDVLAVIANDLVSQPGERRRMPRVELRCPVTLRSGSRVIHTHTADLSQGGAKIELHEALAVGREISLALADLHPVEGEIRWTEGGFAGVTFAEELSWQEMMPWLRGVTRRLADAAKPISAALPDQPAWESPLAEAMPAMSPTVALNIPARIREGAERWSVTVVAISTREVEFESYTRPRAGALISIMLPGLEGWPARVTSVSGDRWTCEFAHPLHPAVLDKVLAARAR